MACKTAYITRTIYAVHNVIVINEEAKKELIREIDLNELIAQYKLLNQENPSHTNKHFINIMPFTNSCGNPRCHQQNLNIEFSRIAHIIYLTSIKPCSIFNGTYPRCKFIYNSTMILDPQSNQRVVTARSLHNNNYIYFSGDFVYSKEFITTFSNNLVHAYTTFEGFTEGYLHTLIDLHGNHKPILSANALAKRTEIVWLYYELSRFIFITSHEKSITLPKSF